MPDVVVALQLEHHRMGRLLGFLRRQATNMSLRAPVDHRLLQIAFEYLSGYPDQCHHPKEDLLYRKLVGRSPDLAGSLADLVEEHEKLADLTRNLSRAVDESQRDPSALAGLADRLSAFLDFYHRHMLMEEKNFFPLALARLSRDDLAEIDFTLFDQPDPLFNQEAEEKFAKLSDEITRLGVADKASADQRDESALLATFRDIASFNEAMQRMGERVSLVRSPGGGYELERMGKTLVRIPACSEPRAAWCAYFFWKAGTTRKAAS
jgi:hemerythrin-like domain-containing protein